MRARDFINEIERIPAGDYVGGVADLPTGSFSQPNKLKPLPGRSGLLYYVKQSGVYTLGVEINIYEPKEYRSIGKLTLEKAEFALPNAYTVDVITVRQDYRNQGIAKALYGIALSILKFVLIAGDLQTPGGRRNWVSLNQIPGVEVKGFVKIDKDAVDYKTAQDDSGDIWPGREKQMDRLNDQLMALGGQYVGDIKHRYHNESEVWAFDVVPGKTELTAYVKNNLSKVYHGYDFNEDMQTGLFAVWTGR